MIAAKDWADDAKGLTLSCRLTVRWDRFGHWAVEGEQGDLVAVGKVAASDDAEFDARMQAFIAVKLVMDKSIKELAAHITTVEEHRYLHLQAVAP